MYSPVCVRPGRKPRRPVFSQRDSYIVKLGSTRVCIKLKTINDEDWKAKVRNDTGQENGNKLRTYRLYKSNLIAEDYVKTKMERSHRHIIDKFMSGSLPFQIETGRYKNQRCHLKVRICNLSTDIVIEDEIHFLLCCDFCSDIRRPFLAKAQLCKMDFHDIPLLDKFIFIMN